MLLNDDDEEGLEREWASGLYRIITLGTFTFLLVSNSLVGGFGMATRLRSTELHVQLYSNCTKLNVETDLIIIYIVQIHGSD